jgi:hypothetical protein
LAARDAALIGTTPRPLPTAGNISAGYGSALIGGFVAAEVRRGVVVIGGLPVDDREQALPPDVPAAIRAVYTRNGGAFLALPDESHYPARDFFNSEDHLAKPCQYLHSIALAAPLGAMLHRPASPPPPAMAALAAACP